MRKISRFIFVLSMLAAASVQGQGIPLELWVSTGVSTFHNKSYNQFSQSFNAYNANAIDRGLDGFGLGTVTNWGATVSFFDELDDDNGSIIDFSLYASNQHTQDRVYYTDSSHRNLDLKRHFVGFEMGFGPRWGRAALLFNWGVLMGNSILNSYYVYADGTESHGQEKYFTGIFDSFNAAGYIGAKFTYRIGQFKALAKVTYGGDLFGRTYFRDNNMAKGLNVTQGDWPDELPTDVAGYYSAYNNSEVYKGDYLQNKFGSLGIQIGLAYSFLR